MLSKIRQAGIFHKIISGQVVLKGVSPSESLNHYRPILEKGERLLRALPEEMGVPSLYLKSFLKKLLETDDVRLHTFMVLRHGRVIAEGAVSPYRKDCRQVVHSIAKSITGMAIGLLEAEGKVALSERVSDIFPEEAKDASDEVRQITVEQLLLMSSGILFDEARSILEEDWVRAFFASGCAFTPGEGFKYNSMNSYMLSAIVQKRTGETLLDYLMPRLFEPLGITHVRWQTCPKGITKGGWGLYLYLEDMAKLGQLFLNRGKWEIDGKMQEIIPASWVLRSVSTKNWDKSELPKVRYGYHLWTTDRAFLFNGMFGQYVLVYPLHDMVIALTSGSTKSESTGPALWVTERFFRAKRLFSKKPLPQNPKKQRQLQLFLENLEAFPKNRLSFGKRRSFEKKFLNALSGRVYRLSPVPLGGLCPTVVQCMQGRLSKGISKVSFLFREGTLSVSFTEGEETNQITVKENETIYQKLVLGGEPLLASASASWRAVNDRPALVLRLCYIELPHTKTVLIRFDSDERISVFLKESPSAAHLLQAYHPPKEGTEGFWEKPGVVRQVERFTRPCIRGVLEP